MTEICRRSLDRGDDLPAARGARPHVTVLAGLDTLLQHAGAPAGDGAWTGPVSAELLRRLACDAGITRVLLDPAGAPLDVGREHRTVTPRHLGRPRGPGPRLC